MGEMADWLHINVVQRIESGLPLKLDTISLDNSNVSIFQRLLDADTTTAPSSPEE
jgi:hypothetical protein